MVAEQRHEAQSIQSPPLRFLQATEFNQRGKQIKVSRELVYISAWLGLDVVATLEPKPGIPPSSAYLGELLKRLEQNPARLVIRAPYVSERASEWLAARAGIPAIVLPTTVGGTDAATDLFGLFDDILSRLLEAGT